MWGKILKAIRMSTEDGRTRILAQLSFHGWKNEIVVYGADGRFDHIWTPSVSVDEFPAMGVFDYLDADLIAGYYSATDSLPARIALFRGR
ncbi:MAG: hypothetical protein ACLRS8_14530 [Parabacteroides merdae]